MTNQLFKYAVLAFTLAVSVVGTADVLLNDALVDADRTETALPDESAVWVSHPAGVTMGAGSLSFDQTVSSSSQKMWTYFTLNGNPVSMAVGDQLIAMIEFTPRTALYETTSKNFRFGLFNDPTNDQRMEDFNSDSGGTGDPWADSTGYAVHFPLSSGPSASNASVGKRITGLSTSLLGSGSAYPGIASGGASIVATLDTQYTLTFTLNRTSETQMEVTFAIADAGGVISTQTIIDDGTFGGQTVPIYTNFDQLFFRYSSAAGTADVLDFHSIKIEHITSSGYQGPPVGVLLDVYADVSCRTNLQSDDGPAADLNVTDSSKLSVRGDHKAAKSWIRFDISDFDPNDVRTATLRVTLLDPKSSTCLLSAVNDDCHDNIGWTESTLTWNNAPGNYTSSDSINPDDGSLTLDQLQDGLDPTKTTLIGTVDYSYGGQTGDQFFFNVLPILQADTDGIVQFVLHGAGGSTNFATHDYSGGEQYHPMLQILEAPAGADYPIPYLGQTVSTSLAALSWTNPEPNLPGGTITCDVYLAKKIPGQDPNRPEMDKVTLTPGVSSVEVNSNNFPHAVPLENLQEYYWIVDCYDSTTGLIPGLVWNFLVNDNALPFVDAGPDQVTWGLPKVINLDGATSDDGLPNPPASYAVQWTQTSGPVNVVIDPSDTDDTAVTITEAGVYVFKLEADDGDPQVEEKASDTVRIVVGEDACDASHLSTGADYAAGDVNEDCLVNLEDFALLIAVNWMDCTDMLTNCGL